MYPNVGCVPSLSHTLIKWTAAQSSFRWNGVNNCRNCRHWTHSHYNCWPECYPCSLWRLNTVFCFLLFFSVTFPFQRFICSHFCLDSCRTHRSTEKLSLFHFSLTGAHALRTRRRSHSTDRWWKISHEKKIEFSHLRKTTTTTKKLELTPRSQTDNCIWSS